MRGTPAGMQLLDGSSSLEFASKSSLAASIGACTSVDWSPSAAGAWRPKISAFCSLFCRFAILPAARSHVNARRCSECLGRGVDVGRPNFKRAATRCALIWNTPTNCQPNHSNEDPSNNCMPAGVPRMGVPSYISQTATYLFFIYPRSGSGAATSLSHDSHRWSQAPPLEDLDGTWNGSIGRREGDTMVVDSIGFNSTSWFDQLGGYFHSENMHVIERLHRDGNTLTWTATVEDPDVLLEPWTTTPRVVLLNPDPKAVLGDPAAREISLTWSPKNITRNIICRSVPGSLHQERHAHASRNDKSVSE